MPLCRAIRRELQCVAPLGVLSSVRTITASTCSSVILRGTPGFGSSYRPSTPRAMNRRRHLLVLCARGARQHDARASPAPAPWFDAASAQQARAAGPRSIRLPVRAARSFLPLISESLTPIMARIFELGR